MKQTLNVENDAAKERLDKFLCRQYPQYSRAHLQKLIKKGMVLVNGKNPPVHLFLKGGDQVEITPEEPAKIDLTPDEKKPLQIVFEDDDFLVVNKEAGLAVHPAESCREKTLVNRLLAHLPSLLSVGEDPSRPGIVHRLDKDVSGLMVVAKNQKSFIHLKNLFQSHLVKKEYLALVTGRLIKEEGLIDFPIARGKEGKFVARPQNQTGEKAITHYRVIKRYSNYTYLEIRTYTGRTHQIRVHLKALGVPIVGDQLYKNKKIKEKIRLNRIFLHADKLGFYSLNNQWLEFSQKLPPELSTILNELKGQT
ncbi:MAG: RluA family pseudouridine synthase [Patescibacteria group bacterium]